MKKIPSSLFAVILVASLATVALPGALQTSAQEAVEGPSTYEFSYEAPEAIVIGNDVNVDVTFSTDMLGTEGYEGVRFYFEAVGPGDASFTATDSEANVFTFTNSGYWGPAVGFSLPADYTATTTWTLNFSTAGEYTIEFSLIYADSDDVITAGSETFSVQTESTYAFSYTVPENIVVNTDIDVDVTLATDMPGTEGYENVQFSFTATGPGDVTFTATDSLGDVYTFTNSGTWGQPEGFALPAIYSATTTWSLNFSAAGEYIITFNLDDLNTSEPVTSSSVAVGAQALAATINIEPETLNVGAGGRWITAYIEVPEGYAAENVDASSVQMLFGEQSLTADWGDLQDSLLMVKFDRATVASWMAGMHDVTVELAVSGDVSGFGFEGVDSIRVIAPPVREQTNAGTPNRPDDIPGKGLGKEVGPARTQNNQGDPGKPEGISGKGNSKNAIPEYANGQK